MSHEIFLKVVSKYYRIAGNFGGSKFWRMTQILRFGEFNFGALRLAHVLLQYKKHILANFILANADDSPNSPKFPPAKITRYTVLNAHCSVCNTNFPS